MKFVDEFRCGEPAVLAAIDGLLADRAEAERCIKASCVLTEADIVELEPVFVNGVHVGTQAERDARAARLFAQAEAADPDPVILSDEEKWRLANELAETLDGFIRENKAKRGRKMMKELRPGKIVYYVHGLGESSFITKYMITGLPYPKNLGLSAGPSMFVHAKYFFKSRNEYGNHDSDFSLEDCNVIPNEYNQHRLFLTAQAANRYLEWAKRNTSAPDMEDDMFGWGDY